MTKRPRSSRAETPDRPDTGSFEFQRLLLNAIVSATPDGILVVDAHDTVVSVNAHFFTTWGLPRDMTAATVTGTPDQPVLAQAVERVSDPGHFLARVKELYADPELDDYCEIALKDGRTLERHSTVLKDSAGGYLGRVWFFRDITQRKRTEAELRDLACRDPLTGISNRRHFFERGNEEFARARRSGQPLAVVELDLDDFKLINDRHGHAAGDQVLISLSRCCVSLLRASEIFARIGGEEFCALLPQADLAAARQVAERLRLAAVGQEPAVDGIFYTLSAGVASLSANDRSIEDILRRADLALYQAKKNGKNRVETATE
jgi:diguanylate cyclase (GGDEF)-like protein